MDKFSKYVKRPVEIEAVQFDGSLNCANEIVAITEGKVSLVPEEGMGGDVWDGKLYIRTLDSIAIAESGDFVIRGSVGEYYPCKPTIFINSYQRRN